MLRLFKRVYPRLATLCPLLVFSDEDRAFIKATAEVLPSAKTLICTWHKMKNVKKKRSSSESKTGAGNPKRKKVNTNAKPPELFLGI